MTTTDTIKLLSYLQSVYPTFKVDNPEMTVKAWTLTLADYDAAGIEKAAIYTVRKSGGKYAPTISEIISTYGEMIDETQVSEGEAWGHVLKALSNGIYNAKSEFDKLTPAEQIAVGNHYVLSQWARESGNLATFQANFKNAYKQAREMTKNKALLIGTTEGQKQIEEKESPQT